MVEQPSSWKATAAYVLAWLASTALVVVDVLVVRGLIVDIASWAAFRRATSLRQQGLLVGNSGFGWTIQAVDLGALLVLACIGVSLSIFFEYHYRMGQQKGVFLRRVARITAIQVAVIGVGLLLQRVFS